MQSRESQPLHPAAPQRPTPEQVRDARGVVTNTAWYRAHFSPGEVDALLETAWRTLRLHAQRPVPVLVYSNPQGAA